MDNGLVNLISLIAILISLVSIAMSVAGIVLLCKAEQRRRNSPKT